MPQEAVDAFVTALQKNDNAELHRLLGPNVEALLWSGDAVRDKADRKTFLAEYAAKHSLSDEGEGTKVLVVGDKDWPFPVPVVEHRGKWRLDGAAGADEIIYRRVGRNELSTIATCRGFVGAEKDYAAKGRDGDPAGIYALKLISDEGMHNGLYWPICRGRGARARRGPFLDRPRARDITWARRGLYHGYYYCPLYAQGANANAVAREYFKDGVMTEGFAAVAWPADYGASGVQTFIVNQDGVVFQKDLGEHTSKAVNDIKSFDPDSSWTAITPDESDAAN